MTEPKKDFTLYIGDLDPAVTEQDLNNLFRSLHLNVKNIRLVVTTNAHSGAIKYAYVTFENREEAEKARRDANDAVIYNRHIRVCFMNRNRQSKANLFVKGLGNTSARDLESYFSASGAIVSCKICYDEKGVSRGYGFLQYDKEEDAEAAIAARHNTLLNGATITVEHFVPRDQREMPHPNNIYVRGFGPDLTNEALKARFEEFGEVGSSIILPNRGPSEETRFFGFVCFTSSESANRAITAMHMREEGGIQWYVAPHLNRHERSIKIANEFKQRQEYWKQRNLYISKLQPAIDEEKLFKLFQDFGEITSVKVLKSENIKYDAEGNKYLEQLSKGSGFVCFNRPEDAERAFNGMNRKKVEDREIRVFRWKPKSEMQKFMLGKRHRQQAYQMYMPPQPQFKGAGRGGRFIPNPMQMPMMQQPELIIHPKPTQYSAPHHHYQAQRPRPPRQPEPVHVPHVEQALPQQIPINMVEYKNSNDADKKRLLGENLYPRILKLTNQNVAGKVTGMLLEMRNEELLEMLTNPGKLNEKVDEAIEVLREAWKSRPDQLLLLGGK